MVYSCENAGYGDDGVRFEYKRSEKEDMNVVPYNPYLLLAWGGHVNVQLKPGEKLKENLSIIFTMELKLKY